jgi:hypothetical protein
MVIVRVVGRVRQHCYWGFDSSLLCRPRLGESGVIRQKEATLETSLVRALRQNAALPTALNFQGSHVTKLKCTTLTSIPQP